MTRVQLSADGAALRAAQRLVEQTPERELVPQDPRHSVRWHEHGYPSPLSRWNYHPELEVHLIRRGTGRFIIGDRIDTFRPGHFVLVGPNLPHNWIGDGGQEEPLKNRDAVLQFRAEWLQRCQEVLPELDALKSLWADAARGIEFSGDTAREGARRMELIGRLEGAARVEQLFGLFATMAGAPGHERRLLAREWFMPPDDNRMAAVMDTALSYVSQNLHDEIRMSRIAALVGMTDSAFSKYFLKASNMTFTDMVRRMRLSQACRLLDGTDETVAAISHGVGYSNLSNFNRQFRREYGVTPTAYRTRGG